MAEPLRFIWPAVEAVRPVFSRAAIVRWPAEDHAALVNAKLIVPDGEKSIRIRCPECGRTHVCRPFAREQPDGTVRCFVPCPENLRAEVRPKDLQLWRVDIERLVSIVAHALSLTGRPKNLGDGRVWRCGRASFGDVLRDVLFARGLRRKDAATYRRAITSAHRPIVLVGTELPEPQFWQGRVPTLVCVSEVAVLADAKLKIDIGTLIRLIRACDQAQNESATQARKRDSTKIRRGIKEELKSHLTDDVLVAAYKKYGSYNKAVTGLAEEGVTTNRWAVERAVGRAGGPQAVTRGDDSESVVRSLSSHRRDIPIENRNSLK